MREIIWRDQVGIVSAQDQDEPVEREGPHPMNTRPQKCAKASATISQTTFPMAINKNPRQISPDG
jgi:hypothetical protein